MRERYEPLALLDEKRMRALYHVQGYHKRIARAFNKKVKSRNLKEGDLVLISNPRGKMKPRWSRPFVIKKIIYRRTHENHLSRWGGDVPND